MPRTRIKICGVRTVEHALAAAAAGADAVGLVFAEGSPREINLAQARAIVEALPALVEPVGLFVNGSVDRVRETATELGLRTVQLHGGETPEQVRALAPLRVIRGLGFDSTSIQAVLAAWQPWPDNLAALLLDAPPKPVASDGAAEKPVTGGTGRTLDHAALAALLQSDHGAGMPPIMLAGGLTPENVGAAIRTVRPWAVDVSSGIESSRGVKDLLRIAAFGAAVRRAD